MKPFNLEKAKAGAPVFTRDGRDVRLLCFDRKSVYPICGLVDCTDGGEAYETWTSNGMYRTATHSSEYDLFLKEDANETDEQTYYGVRIIYPDKVVVSRACESIEEAFLLRATLLQDIALGDYQEGKAEVVEVSVKRVIK